MAAYCWVGDAPGRDRAWLNVQAIARGLVQPDGSDVDRYNTGTPSVFTTAAAIDVGAPGRRMSHVALEREAKRGQRRALLGGQRVEQISVVRQNGSHGGLVSGDAVGARLGR